MEAGPAIKYTRSYPIQQFAKAPSDHTISWRQIRPVAHPDRLSLY